MIPTSDPAPATAQPEGLRLVPEGRRVRSPSGGASFLVPMIPTSNPAPATAQPEGLGPVPEGDSSPVTFLLGCLFLLSVISSSDPAPAKAQPEGLGLVPVGDSSPFLLPTFLHFRRPS